MTTKKNSQESTELMMNKNDSAAHSPREDNRLDRRYGKIGISAVAAAVAYQSAVKNPAYAPVVPDAEKWLTDEFAMA
jgi:hypothetical protein